jgi:hypothetical protein
MHILAATSVPFTLSTVQVPNLAQTHTKRITVRCSAWFSAQALVKVKSMSGYRSVLQLQIIQCVCLQLEYILLKWYNLLCITPLLFYSIYLQLCRII